MKASKKQIEAAAKAIRFFVPLDGSEDAIRFSAHGLICWTDKGLAEMKWPKEFSGGERKLIREIARRALTAKA